MISFIYNICLLHGIFDFSMKRSRDDRDQTGSDRAPGSSSMNVPGANRGWRVIHQSLVIWNLNMRTKSLMAFVDFRIKTTNPNLKGKVEIITQIYRSFYLQIRANF